MLENPDLDIVGSSVLLSNESNTNLAQSGKVVTQPTLDGLIKFNMLFYCCLAHPTLMFRVSTVANKIRYSIKDEVSKAFEDYELWLRLIYGSHNY